MVPIRLSSKLFLKTLYNGSVIYSAFYKDIFLWTLTILFYYNHIRTDEIYRKLGIQRSGGQIFWHRTFSHTYKQCPVSPHPIRLEFTLTVLPGQKLMCSTHKQEITLKCFVGKYKKTAGFEPLTFKFEFKLFYHLSQHHPLPIYWDEDCQLQSRYTKLKMQSNWSLSLTKHCQSNE